MNINNHILNLLNSKYPTIVSNDDSDYDSGSVSAAFLKVDDECNFITGYQATKYRTELINWLSNKKPKILKLDNGKLMIISITGQPSETEDGHPELKNINFEFVEIGDTNSESDLYRYNLSDVEPGRW